jgi:membrane protein YqaA with SNARE-associated domain
MAQSPRSEQPAQEDPRPPAGQPTRRQKVSAIVIIAASLALSLAVFFLPIRTEALGVLGYAGIFIITLLGAMTLFIPGPTMVAAFLIGSTLNPLLVSLCAGLGSAIGETTGYSAGYASRALIRDPGEKQAWYWWVLRWMGRFPFLTLFVLSAIPNFLTDVSGLIAGRIRYPYWRFLLATFLGKTIRFGLSAYLGAKFGRQWLGQ